MRSFWLLLLLSTQALAAERHLTLTTLDGRTVTGAVVLESERGILIRTASGNVLVEWREIESSQSPHDSSSATPTDPPEPSTRARVGLGAGLGVGDVSVASSSRGGVWLPVALSLIVDAPFGPLGLRVAVPLEAGPVRQDETSFKGFAGIDAQLWLNFSKHVSSGLGLQAGLEVSSYYSQWLFNFAFGPTLTPIAIRFGQRSQHELSLEGRLTFVPSSDRWVVGGGSGIIRYAHFF